jgi:hypothetical protein
MIAPVASHAPSNTNWEAAQDLDESVVGARYRLNMTIRAPYTIGNIEKLETALRWGTGLNNVAAATGLKEKITIESFVVHYPRDPKSQNPTWSFTMVFRKTSIGTPLHIIIGLVALVVTLSILAAVVGHTIEKEGTKIQGLADTVLNPFVIIAAVIIVLALSGRSLKNVGGFSK